MSDQPKQVATPVEGRFKSEAQEDISLASVIDDFPIKRARDRDLWHLNWATGKCCTSKDDAEAKQWCVGANPRWDHNKRAARPPVDGCARQASLEFERAAPST